MFRIVELRVADEGSSSGAHKVGHKIISGELGQRGGSADGASSERREREEKHASKRRRRSGSLL